MALNAAASSAPLREILTLVPHVAASIITPMILLALTLRPLRSREISQLNGWAVVTSLAAARACSPSLFITGSVSLITGLAVARDLADIFIAENDPLPPPVDHLFDQFIKRQIGITLSLK